MDIVKITDIDLDAHAQLYAKVFSGEPWNENWSLHSATERLKCYRDAPNFVGVQASDRDNLFGFAVGNIEPYQSGYIFVLKEMCVLPRVQKQGIGRALLRELDSILQKNKVTAVNLMTRIGSDAEGFYKKHGYTQSNRIGLYVKYLGESQLNQK